MKMATVEVSPCGKMILSYIQGIYLVRDSRVRRGIHDPGHHVSDSQDWGQEVLCARDCRSADHGHDHESIRLVGISAGSDNHEETPRGSVGVGRCRSFRFVARSEIMEGILGHTKTRFRCSHRRPPIQSYWTK